MVEGGTEYRYQVYVPLTFTPQQSWPVILFLHGSGERGDDGIAPTQGGLTVLLRKRRHTVPAIVVMPQVPKGGCGVSPMKGDPMTPNRS